MDKKQLTDLLNRYTDSSAGEATEVIALSAQYPYSQLLRALAARASKDHNLPNQQSILQLAAVYSTDRSVLREIMSAAAVVKSVPAVLSPVAGDKDSVDYADVVLKDLKRLHELKHNFEEMVTAFENGIPVVPEKKVRKSVGRPKKVVEAKADPLIEEIKTTKKKIAPENEKTKEQIEIIDQFIKAQPSITARPRSEMAPAGDLTEVKNGEFADNVISETLV
ncbi:MAG TPA: hypothetical protein VFM90_11475, partial [Cyclobacteriaceae bacterium]|nr:hypothetical protein [Cyclobacteriaceae bacterium]